MCGIAGIVNLDEGLAPATLEQMERMIGAIRYRGPDEFGVFRDGQAALCHARLSIIDLATGQQPMSNEDGSLWAVFNGEIFNHQALQDGLRRLQELIDALVPGLTCLLNSSGTVTNTRTMLFCEIRNSSRPTPISPGLT